MFVDCYFSKTHPTHGLVVPAGKGLQTLDGLAAEVLEELRPIALIRSTAVDFAFRGPILDYVQGEIAQHGVALVHRRVHRSDILERH